MSGLARKLGSDRLSPLGPRGLRYNLNRIVEARVLPRALKKVSTVNLSCQ
jgi:hypothetical protein